MVSRKLASRKVAWKMWFTYLLRTFVSKQSVSATDEKRVLGRGVTGEIISHFKTFWRCVSETFAHRRSYGELLPTSFRFRSQRKPFWDFDLSRCFRVYRLPTSFRVLPAKHLPICFFLLTYLWNFRLPTASWDLHSRASFRWPSGDFLKKVWKISILGYNMSEIDLIERNPSATSLSDVLPRLWPMCILQKISWHLLKKMRKKYLSQYAICPSFSNKFQFLVKFAQHLEFSNGSSHP